MFPFTNDDVCITSSAIDNRTLTFTYLKQFFSPKHEKMMVRKAVSYKFLKYFETYFMRILASEKTE